MMNIIINTIGISWLILHYMDFINEFNDILKNYKRIILIPKTIINCFKCLSFWVGLIITGGDVGLSAFISLMCFILDKYLLTTDIKL